MRLSRSPQLSVSLPGEWNAFYVLMVQNKAQTRFGGGNHRLTDADQSEPLAQIRANIAFEHLVVSTLIGAGAGAGLVFLHKVLVAVWFGGFSIGLVLLAALEAVLTSFLIFLTGFLSGALLIYPLFRWLEKKKRRSAWHYLAAAFAISLLIFAFLEKGPMYMQQSYLEALVSIFFPAMIIALVFVRRMQPFWRTAERAEREGLGFRDIETRH